MMEEMELHLGEKEVWENLGMVVEVEVQLHSTYQRFHRIQYLLLEVEEVLALDGTTIREELEEEAELLLDKMEAEVQNANLAGLVEIKLQVELEDATAGLVVVVVGLMDLDLLEAGEQEEEVNLEEKVKLEVVVEEEVTMEEAEANEIFLALEVVEMEGLEEVVVVLDLHSTTLQYI